MVGHWGSSAGSYLANPTSPIPSHCASIVVTSTLRVNHKWTLIMNIHFTLRDMLFQDGFLEKLSTHEFVQLSRAIEGFVTSCAALCGKKSTSLRTCLQSQVWSAEPPSQFKSIYHVSLNNTRVSDNSWASNNFLSRIVPWPTDATSWMIAP